MLRERPCLKGLSQRAVEDLRHHSLTFACAYLCTHIHVYTAHNTHEYKQANKPQNNKILNQLYKKVNEVVTILKGCTVLENEFVSVYCCVIYSLQS